MRNIKTREGYDLWDKVHQLPRFNFWRGGEDDKGCVIRVPEKHGNWVNFNDLTTLADQYQDEINSLREQLVRLELKSVKACSPATQLQGEPVAVQCDQAVFDRGSSVCLVDIPKETAEVICRNVSAATGCMVDWHYIGGRVHIKALRGEQPASESVAPEGYCIMPRRLTAENGAKALLIGEFTLEVTMDCPECSEMEEPSEGCEICDGEGEYGQKHTISWDQIKFIYSKAVEGLAK